MVEKLFLELSELDGVEAIVLGGSRTGTVYDEKWILYDRDGRLLKLKERYAILILRSRSIIERNIKRLRRAMPAYEVQIAKAGY